MHRLHIEIRGLTASFRVPHMFKYHRSLPLPPYTSVVGMFGAAIGRDMATAQELFKYLGLKMGVAGTYRGGCNDTWRVLTTQTSENDVVERQILFKPSYHLIFYGEESSIQICEKAFKAPVYPISLGRPDDLTNVIVHDSIESEPEELEILQNTVFVGLKPVQFVEDIFNTEDPKDHGPSTLIYRLPVQYYFNNDFSYNRVANAFRDFTFIGNHKVLLKEPVMGFPVETTVGEKKQTLSIPILEI